MVTHQSHEGSKAGQTDSAYKLDRLKLPSDLSGLKVLDIGCNEGYFCNAAVKRGAASVLGIDANAKFLQYAIDNYQTDVVKFKNQSWSMLPSGPFDLILWTSAMHYELDPASVLKNIHSALAPNGTFVLECGALQNTSVEMIYSVRHDGGLWYPTQRFLEQILSQAGFAFRIVSHPELVGTDPIPRLVLHARRHKPSVMLISGPTQKGKSNLAFDLSDAATKIISLDHFVSRIANAKWAHTPVQKMIKDKYNKNDLSLIYKGIDECALAPEFAALLANAVANSDKLVIFEGALSELQIEALSKLLSERAYVWRVVG